MNRQKPQSEEPFKRTAIYIAPAAYSDPVDLKYALKKTAECVERKKELKLMRIYRDEKVEITGNKPEDKRSGKRTPLRVKGNEAWNRLLTDIETSAVEAVAIYAARTVAPTIYGLADMIRGLFLPGGIRFIDAEAGFDSANGDADAYIKARTEEYRRILKRKTYKKRKRKEAEACGQTESNSKINTALFEENCSGTVENGNLCKAV